MGEGLGCHHLLLKKEQHYRHTLTSIVNSLEESGVDLLSYSSKGASHLGSLRFNLSTALHSLIQTSEGSPSGQFKKFHKHLRRALESEEYKHSFMICNVDSETEEDIEVLHKLCFSFFTGVHVHDFCKRLVREFRGEVQEDFCSESLEKELVKAHECVKSGVEKQYKFHPFSWAFYVKDQVNLGFDPYAQGNIPHVLFSTQHLRGQSVERSVLNIRCGTPTHEDLFSVLSCHAEVNPECRGYFEACRFLKKRHLYVNLQNRERKFLWKNEAPRCLAIEQLQQEYADVLTLVGLDKDSPFYWQEDEFKDLNLAHALKEEMLEQMFEKKNSGFYLSPFLKESQEFKEKVACLLDNVHEKVFSSEIELEHRQRKDFIECFYLFFIDFLIQWKEVDFYNVSCKDCIDRAGGMNSLLYFYHYLQSGADIKSFDLEDFNALVFAPALIVRQREIKRQRLDRLIGAAQALIATRNFLLKKSFRVEFLLGS